MLQHDIWNIAKYKDNKIHLKFVQTAKYCKRSFSLSRRNLQPQVQ